jgi:hypothetical protein
MKNFIIIIFGILIFTNCGAKMPILWKTELSLGGVPYGDSKAPVLHRLGQPTGGSATDVKFQAIEFPGLKISFGDLISSNPQPAS